MSGSDSDSDRWVEFDDVTVKVDTPKALLCIIEGDEVWIPLSQISEDSEVYRYGSSGKLIVSRWIADQKGLT